MHDDGQQDKSNYCIIWGQPSETCGRFQNDFNGWLAPENVGGNYSRYWPKEPDINNKGLNLSLRSILMCIHNKKLQRLNKSGQFVCFLSGTRGKGGGKSKKSKKTICNSHYLTIDTTSYYSYSPTTTIKDFVKSWTLNSKEII